MDYTSIIAGLVVVGVLIYYYLTRTYGYWEKAGVPYLKDSLPGLGNVYPTFFMTKNLTDMYREIYERMPGCSMVGFYNIRSPALLVRDPELVKSVLQTNFQNFNKNGFFIDPKSDLLLSGNPFFARRKVEEISTFNKIRKTMFESSVVTGLRGMANIFMPSIAKKDGVNEDLNIFEVEII